MAIRKNTFLIKRSNIPGKIPNPGDLQLGELALNTSDVILYASGTTANSILPIGWDRVSRTGDTMTGGLFTPFLSATTISATSINRVDYIVFNTGTTSAATVAGTVYFDNTEKALSYNTSINQGVTVNLGQQNYIRVFNNSGTDIARGKALEILSAYSGLPAVTLAINNHEGFNVIGVSAEIIPNGKEGIAITNGIISDIELTGMTVGSLIYASDNVPGKLDDTTKYLSFPLTARTNQIGFVVQTGVTTGKLFVNINNENSVLSLTDLERNVLEGNTISTGAFEYTGMTTASTTTFNVAPLKGWLVKNTYTYALLPDVQSIEYTGGTNISVTNILTSDSTYILINSGLTITQQTTFPTPQERRENIFLGKINHPNRTSILNINNTVDYDVSPMSSLRDLWSPIRLINDGIIPSPNGANLSFNTSAGSLWGNGINWHNNQLSPNNVNIAAKVPASFFYRTQTGGTTSSVTVIDPRNYDVGGVITSIGNANLDSATNQRIYLYPTGVINVLYGQTVYTSLAAAVAAVQSEAFIPYPNAASTGILIGILSVRNDIGTDGQPLTNASYAKFAFVSKFGESFGGTGGLSTTTLQQAYDNSATPEIVLNAVLDGLSIQNGTGNADNVTRLLEGLNAAGDATSFIRADGDISGTTLQTNGFTGNSTGMSALTVNIRTIGSGTSITNLGIDSLGNVVSGTTGGNGSTFTGGTITGPTNFTNGVTANTISATTYFNLPVTADTFVTGFTYSNNTFTISRNNNLSALTQTVNTMTGLTINGNLTVSGGTQSWFSGNSSSDLVRITQTGTGNAFVVEDSVNPDSTPFTISNDGRVSISTNPIVIPTTSKFSSSAYNDGYSTAILAYGFNPLGASEPAIQTAIIAQAETGNNIAIGIDARAYGGGGDFTPIMSIAGKFSTNGLSSENYAVQLIDGTEGLNKVLISKTTDGKANWSNSLSGLSSVYTNTISATTYLNLPLDIRVTGGTYLNNTFTYTNNTGGTFSTLFNTVTGLTVNGILTVTGNTNISGTTVVNGDLITNSSLKSLYSSGSEGGEIILSTSQTGTTLSGGSITIDINENRFRIFETGGTNRGAYIDLTAAVAGVGSNLLSGGGGESNTASNLGSGIGLFAQKSGVDLQFKSLTSTGGTVTITSGSTTVNLEVVTASNFTGGTVNGATNFTNGLTANTISATTYLNLPVTADTFVTGFTYSNNTFTISRNNNLSALTQTVNTMTGLTVNGNLTVTGNTSVKGLTGTTATLSGSGQNILTIIGSGSTSPIFSVVGSSGELFSITDSLTGSLFSVNDISGLPILEVFSDNTTLMGNYLAPSLNTTTKVTLTAGTNTVYSIPTSAYTGAFFDYVVISSGSTGARAGNIMAIWSGTTAQYTDVSTNDIGNTAGITFSVAVSGNNAVLSSSATTAGWTLKTIIRSI